MTLPLNENAYLDSHDNPWKLYSDMPRCKAANKAITNGMNKIVKWIGSTKRSQSKNQVLSIAMAKAEALLTKYQAFGALDSEPYYKAEKVVLRALGEI